MKGNPKGNLAGYTDPSVPGWQERAMARVKARQRQSKRTTERRDGVRAVWDVPFRALIDEAARRRGMSMAGYCRRAICAFVEHDLGLKTGEGAQYMPTPTNYRVFHGHGALVKTQDDLKGYGKWVIKGLDEA